MIIIPDVHGREFWKKAKEYVNETIVFLGDYVDPYPHEHITNEEAILNFEEILKFKKDNLNNVILLLGNHDCGYLWGDVCQCRRDHKNYLYLKRLFKDNLKLFDITYSIKSSNKNYLLSHAGVHNTYIPENETPEYYNKLLHSDNVDDYDLLGDKLGIVSFWRGGHYSDGSVVWADIHEWPVDIPDSIYQIFGHTQLLDEPVITSTWACLDCRKIFRLNLDNDEITEVK